MSDRMILIGAEDVRSAGHTISSAAETISRAASNIDGALERHQRFLDDWLMRVEIMLRDHRNGGGRNG